MKIDAHQHFWKYNPADYAWIDDNMAMIRRDFLPGELKKLMDSAGFDGSIAVQARQSIVETEWLLELSRSNEFIKGVVGWVNLCAENVYYDLSRLIEDQNLVGIRHVIQDEPDDHFMLRPDFLRGISYLSQFNLTYDLLIFPGHLPVARDLVTRFPEQKFVVDHISKPDIKNRKIDEWASDLKKVGAFPNVYCKLSGMVTEADWRNWSEEDLYPYMDTVMEIFGPGRLMIGSDWPVCLLAGSYQRIMGIVTDYIDSLTPWEKRGILGENCMNFYLGK